MFQLCFWDISEIVTVSDAVLRPIASTFIVCGDDNPYICYLYGLLIWRPSGMLQVGGLLAADCLSQFLLQSVAASSWLPVQMRVHFTVQVS